MRTPLPDIAPLTIPAPAVARRPLRDAHGVVWALSLLGVAAVYVLSARLGLQLALVNPSATAIWPPTGITLVAFLFFGYEVWPAIVIGAFIANMLTAGTVTTSLAIATGNTLEGVAGAYLVTRFAGGLRATENPKDLFRFAALAALLSTTIAATIGVTALFFGGFVPRDAFRTVWMTWWLGDATGALLFAPLLLAWIAAPRLRWETRRAAEVAGMFATLALVGMFVFGGFSFAHDTNYALEYLCIPVLMWSAFRFGVRETASGIIGLAAIAVTGTLHGFGPFVRPDHNESLLLLQVFLGVITVTCLSLTALVSERRGVEQQLHLYAVTDPLTGLANYRMLMHTIEREIRRSLRTDRPFAILMLDVNGLKEINDEHGHLIGSEALQRVAAAIQSVCREVDTAARYGGDEFAIVLPESSYGAARTLAQRVAERLAADTRTPTVTASAGVAEFPRDGRTIEEIVSAADRGLYEGKTRRISRA